MKKITIEWQHYDKDGTTCDRCATTGASVREVVSRLSNELAENDIDILFTETLKSIFLPNYMSNQSVTHGVCRWNRELKKRV